MVAPRPRFKRLFIREIFGPGSHDVDIEFNLDARVTVLHGRNGSGKTIALRLLEALREGEYANLFLTPWRELKVALTDGSSVQFFPKHDSDVSAGVAFTLCSSDGLEQPSRLVPHSSVSEDAEQKMRKKGIENVAFGVYWRDQQEGRVEPLADLLRRRPELWDLVGVLRDPYRATPELELWRGSLPKVKLIRTERLNADDYDDDEASELAVDHLSERVKHLVTDADREYRKVSVALDSSLGRRLMEQNWPEPDEVAFWEKYRDVSEQEQRLRKLGLLPGTESMLSGGEVTTSVLPMLAAILDDRAKKLEPFKSLVDKVERLLMSFNDKLNPKRVLLDVEKGYRVLSASGTELTLEQLSSGEQHELVLLHELLFEVEPGTLILIDEPELSLHVTWQEAMLPELMEIARLSELDFLLATHSPFIIGEHTELMVKIGPPA